VMVVVMLLLLLILLCEIYEETFPFHVVSNTILSR
jgi:hypothetical protein